MSAARKIELVFYRAASGSEPVREWLAELPAEKRRAIGMDLQRVQYRWPVGMPLVRPLGKGAVRGSNGSARPDHRAGAVLLPRRRTLRAARVRQEGAQDAARRSEAGARSPEGG
jgi:hypothetical protein